MVRRSLLRSGQAENDLAGRRRSGLAKLAARGAIAAGDAAAAQGDRGPVERGRPHMNQRVPGGMTRGPGGGVMVCGSVDKATARGIVAESTSFSAELKPPERSVWEDVRRLPPRPKRACDAFTNAQCLVLT